MPEKFTISTVLDLLDSPFFVLSEKTSLPIDQLKVVLILLACIPLGLFHMKIKTPGIRNLYSFIFGAFFQIFLFRTGFLVTLCNSFLMYLLMVFSPRKHVGVIVFVCSMITLSHIHIKRMIVCIYILIFSSLFLLSNPLYKANYIDFIHFYHIFFFISS